jgi:hypothetical protein
MMLLKDIVPESSCQTLSCNQRVREAQEAQNHQTNSQTYCSSEDLLRLLIM